MTRIFEALKKSQARAGALPFPPVEPTPLRPAVVSLSATPPAPPGSAAAIEPAIVPRVDVMAPLALSDEVRRQMTALRVGLEAALEGQTSRVVMFLGPMGGEGVTTVASQFVSALAVEARGPSLLLNVRAPRGALRGAGEARPAARRGPGGAAMEPRVPEGPGGAPSRGGSPIGVAVLAEDLRRAGSRAPAAMRATLAALANQFEWVVVDGPPVLAAPESVDLGPLVDGVVLVIRSGHTKRPVALRAAEMLRKSGVRLVGSVINRRRLEIPDFIYRRI